MPVFIGRCKNFLRDGPPAGLERHLAFRQQDDTEMDRCAREVDHVAPSLVGSIRPQLESDLSLAGTRVFIVEDEALILDTLQDMLEDLGCQVVESALRVGEALAKLVRAGISTWPSSTSTSPATRIDPVADLLANRGVPFLFATGYGRGSLPAAHRERVLLTKPYRKNDLQAALDAVLPQ